jgi:hypothetical protein
MTRQSSLMSMFTSKNPSVIRDQPVLILHTSGSTGRHLPNMDILHKLILKSGIPKPIVYTPEFFWRIIGANTLPAPNGMMRIDDLFLRGDFFSLLPAFHVSGLLGRICSDINFLNRLLALDGALFSQYSRTASPCILCPTDRRRLMASWKRCDTDTLNGPSCYPSLLTSLPVTQTRYLFYTGGALPPSAGERAVASGISVYSGLGSSECGALPQTRSPDDHLHPQSETWGICGSIRRCKQSFGIAWMTCMSW